MFTEALMDEKTEFLHLMLLNGVVLTEYLTVGRLRHLYNTVSIYECIHLALETNNILHAVRILFRNLQFGL